MQCLSWTSVNVALLLRVAKQLTKWNRALVGVTDSSGNPIFKGRKATGFSNVEEDQAQKKVPDQLPWLMENKVLLSMTIYINILKIKLDYRTWRVV